MFSSEAGSRRETAGKNVSVNKPLVPQVLPRNLIDLYNRDVYVHLQINYKRQAMMLEDQITNWFVGYLFLDTLL